MPAILIIDDDADFSAIAHAHFTKLGYKVEMARDGKAGLSLAAVMKPDILLLDILMPQMNGIEVLRELQAGDETSDIPVVIVSGKYVDQGMIDLFMQESNFRAFVGKPVALDTLQKKVETFIRK